MGARASITELRLPPSPPGGRLPTFFAKEIERKIHFSHVADQLTFSGLLGVGTEPVLALLHHRDDVSSGAH
jgi:hypothetical protein